MGGCLKKIRQTAQKAASGGQDLDKPGENSGKIAFFVSRVNPLITKDALGLGPQFSRILEKSGK